MPYLKVKNLLLCFMLLTACFTSEAQKPNLDFEIHGNGYPTYWANYGSADYKISIDSSNVKSGKYAAVIESLEGKTDFKALAFTLPNYKGTSIRLTGYIKTENVTDGYAGLWMRIDPQIGFDNMHDRGVRGTTEWKQFEIELPLSPAKTERIVVGGMLVGKGKMWLDDLRVTVDGKNINDPAIEIYTAAELPAAKDTAFNSGSSIEFSTLSNAEVHKLELLGRVWGFLKYYHPEVAKGNYNWDNELFRILPAYLAAKNNKARDRVLLEWIGKYGELAACIDCKATSDSAVLKPDLSWIDQPGLSRELSAALKQVYANRNQGDHYYIGLQPAGNPDFKNEPAYANMPYPDGGFRLLSLFKYWNMIEYFFPYKHLTDKKWSSVLKEYIPKFIEAEDELAYELAALRIIDELNDTHANLWAGADKLFELRGNNFAPFRAEFVEDQLVVTDYYNPEHAESSKLKVGDVITHIDGKAVESIVDSLAPYYPASNRPTMLRDIARDLLRSTAETLQLQYLSDQQTRNHQVALFNRQKLNMYHMYKVDKNAKSYKLLDGNIGYITLANIRNEDVAEIKALFKDTKGIVIDIRNYPSAFMPFALGSYFVSEPSPFVRFTMANLKNPGEFTLSKNLEISSQGEPYKGKVVVLLNEISQSQAEYTAMAFRAGDNTTIVGSTTAGADGNVSAILLPGGLRTIISGLGVYYPDGTETQRVGIVPDVVVKPTIEGVRKGEDELLMKAMEIVSGR